MRFSRRNNNFPIECFLAKNMLCAVIILKRTVQFTAGSHQPSARPLGLRFTRLRPYRTKARSSSHSPGDS